MSGPFDRAVRDAPVRGDGADPARIARAFDDTDEPAVVALWHACGLVRPWNDPARDIERKRAVQRELFLVAEATAGTGTIVATAMVGYDGHRGWLNYVATDPAHRRQGHARALVAEAERLLVARGCPKLNLQVRAGNDDAVAFWRALGYAVDETIALGKRLIVDRPT